MKNVVRYQERVRSLFCQNCGETVFDAVPIKEAEAMAKNGAVVHCPKCSAAYTKLIATLDRMAAVRRNRAETIAIIEETTEATLRSLEEQRLSALADLTIKQLTQSQTFGWMTRNN